MAEESRLRFLAGCLAEEDEAAEVPPPLLSDTLVTDPFPQEVTRLAGFLDLERSGARAVPCEEDADFVCSCSWWTGSLDVKALDG